MQIPQLIVDLCFAAFRAVVAIGFSVWGVAIFAFALPQVVWHWPLFFLGMGVVTTMSLAISMHKAITFRSLLDRYVGTNFAPDQYPRRVTLYERVGLIYFILAVAWGVGTPALFGGGRIVAAMAGGSVFLIVSQIFLTPAFIMRLAGWIRKWKDSVRR